MTTYQKRISFDSINPNKQFQPDDPPFIPLQYITTPSVSNKRSLDLNFGYAPTSKSTDVQRVFDGFNELGSSKSFNVNTFKKKKVPKLPPPPKKSILKNHDNSKSIQLVSIKPPRKKSIVDMTTEELLALDAQYRKGVDLNKLKFDGDGYLPQTIDSVETKRTSKQIQKIDKMATSIIKEKNSVSDLNFSSFSTSYKRNGFKEFVKERSTQDSLRDVMVYISGRKHTWDAINWCFKNYLKDGDNLVIVCRSPDDEEDDVDDIKLVVENLKNYVFKVIEILSLIDLKISLNIEFIKEKSVKIMLKQVVQFYEPHVFIVSSLMTQIGFRKNLKLPVFVMKNLNVPVITIPDLIIDESLVNLIKPSPIPILIENHDDDSISPNESIKSQNHELDFINRLNNISDTIEKNKQYQPIEFHTITTRSYTTRSEPASFQLTPQLTVTTTSSSTGSNSGLSRTETSAGEPKSYFPNENYKLSPSIKFTDDLKPIRPNSTSRRGSNNTNNIYKVKSLLDDESIFPIEKTKSMSSSLNQSFSNELERRRSSGTISGVRKVVSESKKDQPKEKKSGFLGGLFKKKK